MILKSLGEKILVQRFSSNRWFSILYVLTVMKIYYFIIFLGFSFNQLFVRSWNARWLIVEKLWRNCEWNCIVRLCYIFFYFYWILTRAVYFKIYLIWRQSFLITSHHVFGPASAPLQLSQFEFFLVCLTDITLGVLFWGDYHLKSWVEKCSLMNCVSNT